MRTENACDRFALDLAALSAGELEAPRAMEVQEHLLSCGNCRALLRELEAQLARLGELEDPPDFEQAVAEVHGRAMDQVTKSPVPATRWHPGFYWAAAACLLALLGTGGWIIHSRRGVSVPQTEQARVVPQPTAITPTPWLEPVPRQSGPAHKHPPPNFSYDPVRTAKRILESNASAESQTVLIQQSHEVVIYWVKPFKEESHES